jgi:hypothetical protein
MSVSAKTQLEQVVSFIKNNALILGFVAIFAVCGGTIALVLTRAATNSVAVVGIGNKCLDNNQNIKANGNRIQLYTCNASSAQKWTINASTGTIINNNGYCLDVKGGSKVAGAVVQLYVCNGTAAQKWKVNASAHTITNPASGLCLDDKQAKTANGNPIQMYTCNGTAAQKWTPTSTTNPAPQPAPTPTPTPTTPNPSPTPTPQPTPTPTGIAPLGVPGTWKIVFNDDFTKDTSIDRSVWSETSAAESQCGQGNHSNGQAEWNQGYTNNTVNSTDGLVITALRQSVTKCNDTFSWTGGLLSSKQAFKPGSVIEQKFQFPKNVPVGGWASFWTWCADGSYGCEVDVYEAWPPNSNGNGTAVSSNHVGGGTSGTASAYVSVGDWHVMSAVINLHDVTWYLDGKAIGSAKHTTAQRAFNVIVDNDVCSGTNCPAPASTTTKITQNVAYVRVWEPAQ